MSGAEHERPLGRRRVGVISLGCAKNLVDTEVMLGHLDRAGLELTPDAARADVILVNTCAFIEASREESIQAILEAAELKRGRPAARLVVAGCMVQRYREELAAELPEVDAFIGLDELDRVVEAVGGPAVAVRPAPGATSPRSDLPLVARRAAPPPPARPAGSAAIPPVAARFLYDDRTPRLRATPPAWAYVKIAEGCDHTCAFCAIPGFRGAFRSRRPESVEAEARALAADGVREINLIAQDSSHYGRDLGLRDGLAALLCRLDGVPELAWIRLHYLYPNTITPALVAAMAELERVVEYVDLPLQHAHPAVLGRMRRGGSGEGHLRLLQRFRDAMPGVTLRSTFIVGFPGETEAEFAELLEFVEAARFDHLGAFTYSHEDGTPARALADDVPEAVKRERLGRLMELQQPIAFERNRRLVGRVVDTLVEGVHPETEHLLAGRMRSQAPDVDGQVLINDGVARPGEIVRVELTDVAGYDLVGGVVRPAAWCRESEGRIHGSLQEPA